MAKGGKKKQEIPEELKNDPRVRDPVIFNRLKLMVEHEACHPAWGCVLYQMHRLGQLTNEQKEAGDVYQGIFHDFRRVQELDPNDFPGMEDYWLGRISSIKSRWEKARELLGLSQKAVDSIVIENEQPSGERDRRLAQEGLQLIANFFVSSGRNKRGPRA